MGGAVSRWLHSAHDILTGIGLAVVVRSRGQTHKLEGIRNSMVCALPTRGGDRQTQRLRRRLQLANDVHELWYLRSELLQTMANATGEPTAREQLEQITLQFEGMLPPGMLPRRTEPRR